MKDTKVPASPNRNRPKEVKVNADGARPQLAPLKPVFGVSLDELFHRDSTAVPMIVYQCVQAVISLGLARKEFIARLVLLLISWK